MFNRKSWKREFVSDNARPNTYRTLYHVGIPLGTNSKSNSAQDRVCLIPEHRDVSPKQNEKLIIKHNNFNEILLLK